MWIVQCDITYKTGEHNTSYWRGSHVWASSQSDAVQFDTKREAMRVFGELHSTPTQRRNDPHTYTFIRYNGLGDA